MKKRFIIITLFVILVMSYQTVCFSSNFPTVEVANVSGKKGDIVDVPITLSSNSGFVSLGIEIGFDDKQLKLIKAEAKPEVGVNCIPASGFDVNPYNMSWNTVSNINYNGVIAILQFEITGDKSAVSHISVACYKGVDKDYVDGEDVNYDTNFNPLNLKYIDGSVEIKTDSEEEKDDFEISNVVVSFKVNISNTQNGGNIIAALYDNSNKLIESKIYPVESSVNVEFDKLGAYIKVMRWDMKSIRPLTDAKTIKLQ